MEAQHNDASKPDSASNGPKTADELPALSSPVPMESAQPAKASAQNGTDNAVLSAAVLGAPLSEFAAQNGSKPAQVALVAEPTGAMIFHSRLR